MWIDRLEIERLRLFERVELSLGSGLNLFTGANGAGKTSLLEAVHLLAYGRSFRGAIRDGLIRRGDAALSVFAQVREADGSVRRIGIERGLRHWNARVDGQAVPSLSDAYRQVAVVSFEPGSHELIAGGSDHRRRFLDWALFHVEPQFLPTWRRYQRALKQRNAMLKAGDPEPEALDAWEAELADAGEQISVQRETYLARLLPHLRETAGSFLPEAGELILRFQRGWAAEATNLLQTLVANRTRDAVLGHTTAGPHRADWSVSYPRLPMRESFSRGQEKLTALACVLAQARQFVADRGTWPVLCLDDLGSELDQAHLKLALDWLAQTPAQILMTGTEPRGEVEHWRGPLSRFHVEQGQIALLL